MCISLYQYIRSSFVIYLRARKGLVKLVSSLYARNYHTFICFMYKDVVKIIYFFRDLL